MKSSQSSTNQRFFSPQPNSFSFSYTPIKSQNPDTPFSIKRSLLGTLRCDVPARKAGGISTARSRPRPRINLGASSSPALRSRSAAVPGCGLWRSPRRQFRNWHRGRCLTSNGAKQNRLIPLCGTDLHPVSTSAKGHIHTFVRLAK